jgi:hypothetical protein
MQKHKLYYYLLFKHKYFKELVAETVLLHVRHHCHLHTLDAVVVLGVEYDESNSILCET